jgi:signal peptidase II
MLVLVLGLAVLIFDQLTKQAVRNHLIYGESRPIIENFFNLVYVRNDGAAWNILSGQGIILILISVSVLVLLFIYRRAFLQEQLSHRILLGLLVGGIAGMGDRLSRFSVWNLSLSLVQRRRFGHLHCHRPVCSHEPVFPEGQGRAGNGEWGAGEWLGHIFWLERPPQERAHWRSILPSVKTS